MRSRSCCRQRRPPDWFSLLGGQKKGPGFLLWTRPGIRGLAGGCVKECFINRTDAGTTVELCLVRDAPQPYESPMSRPCNLSQIWALGRSQGLTRLTATADVETLANHSRVTDLRGEIQPMPGQMRHPFPLRPWESHKCMCLSSATGRLCSLLTIYGWCCYTCLCPLPCSPSTHNDRMS